MESCTARGGARWVPAWVHRRQLPLGQTDGGVDGVKRKPLRLYHGHARKGKTTKTYMIWSAMRQRCRKSEGYAGRGIRVCSRWRKFENFLRDMGHKPAYKSIECRNNNGNYTPTNCVWALNAQQSRNTRRNVYITVFGKRQCLTDWCSELGATRQAFYYHRRLGRSAVDSIKRVCKHA